MDGDTDHGSSAVESANQEDQTTSSNNECDKGTDCSPIEAASPTMDQKVELILKPVGDTPIIKQKKWSLPSFRTVGWVNAFVRKYLRLEQSDSLYLFVNQSFAPNPDSEVGDLLECFGSDGVFHTILLHRSVGKLHYASDNEFYIGALGTEDVDCDFIDLTYVRVNEEQMKRDVHDKICKFKENLRQRESEKHGEIILQFFEKERGRLLDCVKPWELWILKLIVIRLNSETEHQMYRESVGEALSDIIFSICREINKPRYTPKMPKRQELPQVFDNSYSSFHPYLHKIIYDAASPSYGLGLSSAVNTTVSTVQGLLKMSLNK